MFTTIKGQILLVSATLVLLLMSQFFLSRDSQSTFVESLDLTQQALVKVNLVRELERDVIDLQRNVLIYKELASESAIVRFNDLMQKNYANLVQLKQLTLQQENSNRFQDYISRMNDHLNDYQESFSNVVVGRMRRETLYETGLAIDFEKLFESIEAQQNPSEVEQESIAKAKYHIARAESILLKFSQIPEQQLIEPFQQQIDLAKQQIKQQFSENGNYQIALDKLDKVDKDFLELTKVIRGYLFLVNVVMTGTANEFLFLARELNKLVTESFTLTNVAVKDTLETTRFGGNLFSAIGIIIAAATALFMFYRIILPINHITQIFQRLASGKGVPSIPNLYRKDEIGLLAKAADVFREKNEQTTELLEQSQVLVAKQEALNAQLIVSSQKLEQATASKSMFLANMSHEIRTPMNGIIGMLDIVLRSDLSDRHRSQLSQAAYSGQILMSVINDILDFTKIEAGKLDIENVNFSLESLFDNLLANVSNLAREKNLNVKFDADPNLPTQLIGDPLRLSQILLNLCSNAIKFTRNGEVSIKVGFKAHQNNANITMCFDIIDTGIGMRPEQVNKIFDSFTQADGSTSRKYGGSGLGLSIVKQLVELMKGEITVRSAVNKGSTFAVEVELTKINDNHEIVSALPPYSGKLFYFVHGLDGFLNQQYIEKMQLNYQLIPLYKLATTLHEIDIKDTVLMDINNQETFKNYQDEIDKISEKSIKFGFVTQSQPSNLANQLLVKWPVECLSHPFTPNQAYIYLKGLISTKSNDQDLNETTVSLLEKRQYEGHVLLVEDNSINQAIAGEMLKLLGVTFDVAEDGHQAVTKIVNSSHYDLVFMDIQMPVMDGYEATIELRKQGHQSLAICGLSANAMQQDHEKAIAAGMNDYIVKPLKHESIEKVVAKYLKLKPPSIN